MSDTSPSTPPDARPRRYRDRLATIVSGFVGALALASTVYNVYLQRQQVRAAVLPRLTFQDWHDEGAKALGMSVANRGVGPADVQRTRVYVDGKPTRSWVEALASLRHADSIAPPETKDTTTTIGAGAELPIVSYDPERWFEVLKERRRVLVELCYCSTLAECWIVTGVPGADNSTNVSVSSCPKDPDPFVPYTDKQADELVDAVLASLRAQHAAEAGADAGADAAGRASTTAATGH